MVRALGVQRKSGISVGKMWPCWHFSAWWGECRKALTSYSSWEKEGSQELEGRVWSVPRFVITENPYANCFPLPSHPIDMTSHSKVLEFIEESEVWKGVNFMDGLHSEPGQDSWLQKTHQYHIRHTEMHHDLQQALGNTILNCWYWTIFDLQKCQYYMMLPNIYFAKKP